MNCIYWPVVKFHRLDPNVLWQLEEGEAGSSSGDENDRDNLEADESSELDDLDTPLPVATTSGQGQQAGSHAKLASFFVDKDIDLSSSGLLDLVSDSKDSHPEVIEDMDNEEETSDMSKTVSGSVAR